jgi:hypothetical protein
MTIPRLISQRFAGDRRQQNRCWQKVACALAIVMNQRVTWHTNRGHDLRSGRSPGPGGLRLGVDSVSPKSLCSGFGEEVTGVHKRI